MYRLSVLALVFLALLGFLNLRATTADATTGPAFVNGKFAYIDMQPGSNILTVRNGDGSAPAQVHTSSNLLGSPTWSPNGKKIAFNRGTPAEIIIINSDGTGETNISNNAARDENPAWSPNGAKIAFISDRGRATADYRLHIMNADGTSQTDISEVASQMDRFPRWSPDGTKIYYNSQRSGSEQLYAYNVQTQVTTQFTTLPNSAIEATVSPDGSKVVFAYAGAGDTKIQLYVQNADGSGFKKLFGLCAGEYSQWPTWSPDGRKIIFISECGTNPKSKVHMINSDGTGTAQLVSSTLEDAWTTMAWHGVPVTSSTLDPTTGKIKDRQDGDQSDTDHEVHKDHELFIAGKSGNVIVHADGVLKGTGVTGRIDVEDKGRLAPGSSPGCIASSGLVMTAGSVLDEELGGTTACSGYDQVNVTGTVTLGNATLNIILFGGLAPVVGNTFTVITNDGNDSVTGTFAGLGEGASVTSAGVAYTVSYVGGDGNDVVLTVTSVPAVVPGVPDTGMVLFMSKPWVIFAQTSALAVLLLLISRKYRSFTNR